MAIGDERGVELRGVRSPHHFFLRGSDKEGKELNIDLGQLTTDASYNIDPDLIEKGIYLATLSDRQLEANFLANRGGVLKKLGRHEEAHKAFDRATQLKIKSRE